MAEKLLRVFCDDDDVKGRGRDVVDDEVSEGGTGLRYTRHSWLEAAGGTREEGNQCVNEVENEDVRG